MKTDTYAFDKWYTLKINEAKLDCFRVSSLLEINNGKKDRKPKDESLLDKNHPIN